MEQSASFGDWLTRRRMALRWSRADLARRVACATITLRKIEEDARRPSPELAGKLADHLALTPEERARFIRAARSERSVAWLPSPDQISNTVLHATHLPILHTLLIGRANELAELKTLLAHPSIRLVTLTGPGGSGKTQLALQLVHDLAKSFADGVAFIDLAPLILSDQVLPTIAQALGVRELIGTALVSRVCEHLQPRQMLLALDNFEHLLAGAPLITELLTSAPGLTVLVTSRSALRISFEHECPVDPLAETAAVELFIARARAARTSFTPTEADTSAVAAICRRLDCLPLAIELAAARVRIFTPQDLLTRLEQDGSLALFTTGMRDRAPRQQTIRATIAWSYQLLEPAEQMLFRRLAIFVGGWTFAAVVAICDVDDNVRANVSNDLQALADHSLIRLAVDEDELSRFHQLETIREYAVELLAASDEQATLRHRHALFFCELAEAAAHDGWADAGYWQRRMAADYKNIQAALGWGTGLTGDPLITLRLAVALRDFWFTHNRPLSEGLRWIETALATSGLPTNDPLRAHALIVAGNMVLFKGEVRRAEPLLAQALAIYEALDDDAGCAVALYLLGIQNQLSGALAHACTLQEASIARAERTHHIDQVAAALSALGRILVLRGAYDRAVQVLEACLAIETLQNVPEWKRAHVCALLADALLQRGDDARATALLEQNIPVLRRDGGAQAACTALFARARIAREQADDDLAEALLQESLTLARTQGLAYSLANTHYELGMLALAQNKTVHASREMQKCLLFFRVLENPWFVAVALLGTGLTALLRGDRVAAARDYAESIMLLEAWHENPPARMVGLLAGLMGLLCSSAAESAGAAAQAAQIWGLVTASTSQMSRRVTPPFLHVPRPSPALCEAAIAGARDLLDPAAFDTAWAKGQTLTLEPLFDLAELLPIPLMNLTHTNNAPQLSSHAP